MEENNNIEKIHKSLKRIIISFGALILIGTVLLTTLLLINNFTKKKENQVAQNNKPLIAQNSNFPKECLPLEIETKENYIAIISKKCQQIKIINTRNNSVSFYNY